MILLLCDIFRNTFRGPVHNDPVTYSCIFCISYNDVLDVNNVDKLTISVSMGIKAKK